MVLSESAAFRPVESIYRVVVLAVAAQQALESSRGRDEGDEGDSTGSTSRLARHFGSLFLLPLTPFKVSKSGQGLALTTYSKLTISSPDGCTFPLACSPPSPRVLTPLSSLFSSTSSSPPHAQQCHKLTRRYHSQLAFALLVTELLTFIVLIVDRKSVV